ncbi:hypothetical protein WEI85_16710 [Actinomycetes bacterium KLBMP 9797]
MPIRGNVNTRLARLDGGDVDALLLAVSGLERIGQAHRITQILPVEVMCPSIGAGVLGLQCREDDLDTIETVTQLSDTQTWQPTSAELLPLVRLRFSSSDGRCCAAAFAGRPPIVVG